MARGNEDDGRRTEGGSVLGLAGVGSSRAKLVTRRAVLFGIPALSITAATALGLVAQNSENARHQRALHPPVNPGPATVRSPGTLAGPAATPAWSAKVSSEISAIAVAAGTVLLVDGYGNVRGYDPQSGVEKWQPSVQFLVSTTAPLTVVGDTLYGFDADGDVLAVNASDGTLRWQVQLAAHGVDIATVQGSAGSLVFSTGSIEGRGTPDQVAAGQEYGMLWCLDSKTRGMAWSIDNVDYNLAVAASESAGVVATADEITNRLTAYSLKDQSVVWHKDSGLAADAIVPIAPAACLAVSGNTFYWAADLLYALDASTGDIRWTGSPANPGEEFESVAVLPRQDGSPDLVIATATGASAQGGTLRAFDATTGALRWSRHAAGQFGRRTALALATGGTGVLYAAEADNGSLFAVDARTGVTRWTYHDATATTDLAWSVAADAERAYLAYGTNLLAFEH